MEKSWIKMHNRHVCPVCEFTYWDNKSWNYCPKCGECLGKKYEHKKFKVVVLENDVQLSIDFLGF